MVEIRINPDIPRTMTLGGLEFLGRLARTVPKGGTIVEVGPLFGSSTWVLAKNADPSVRVISIDTWQPQDWIKSIQEKFPGSKPFSKEAFLHYTNDCPNVQAVQGMSPNVMKGWNEPIDLFFDDATHGDPGFTDSLAFYLPKLREGAIACGDDYAAGWPDIVAAVTRLARQWKTVPEVSGRVWALVKPSSTSKTMSVYEKVGLFSPYDLSVSIRMRNGETITYPPLSWSGHLHRSTQIQAIKIDWATGQPGKLSGVYQLTDANGGLSPWILFGQWAETSASAINFRAHLVGNSSEKLKLSYQICNVIQGRKQIVTRNTKAFKDGQWTDLGKKANVIGMSAIRCVVEPKASR